MTAGVPPQETDQQRRLETTTLATEPCLACFLSRHSTHPLFLSSRASYKRVQVPSCSPSASLPHERSRKRRLGSGLFLGKILKLWMGSHPTYLYIIPSNMAHVLPSKNMVYNGTVRQRKKKTHQRGTRLLMFRKTQYLGYPEFLHARPLLPRGLNVSEAHLSTHPEKNRTSTSSFWQPIGAHQTQRARGVHRENTPQTIMGRKTRKQ